MVREISMQTRQELLKALRQRYASSSKKEKKAILDEFVAVSGYHRKHAVRLLCGEEKAGKAAGAEITRGDGCGKRVYGQAVKEALIVAWEAADRICGKRLKAVLADLLDAMERHGHLSLDPRVKTLLLSASAATIDRLLAPVREHGRSSRKRRKPTKPGKEIPVRTFADWKEPQPGSLEIDFVAHCGGSMAGSFIHSLVATDVCSGWTECAALVVREQALVVQGLDALSKQLPFSIRAIDSDNDGAFINETLLSFCKERKIEFTRSRPYHKNDQAWVEQKNGSVVRRLVGHGRFSGVVGAQALAHLYQSARLYVNFFQPSFKLLEKERHGAKTKRTYDAPATPCERLLRHPGVEEDIKKKLRSLRQKLDPLQLLHRIREAQTALAALSTEGSSAEGPGKQSLQQFLSKLPTLWRKGEVRATHRAKSAGPRHWRTRKDPFDGVWLEVLGWLENEPDVNAKTLFDRLRKEYPGSFADGQLRTLQRRVCEWREVMAKKLVFAATQEDGEAMEA